MSIAVLTQVYDEARRLAIAGSAVAPGDFRLKKLVPPLEAAGAKAPVFAKVAESVKAVIESTEKTASDVLLELTSLVNAILYTQGETGLAGNIEPIVTTDLGLTGSQTSARVLKPLLEALQTTGSGRLELIRDAFDRGQFRDLRLVKPALAAIDDGYSEIADLIANKVLPLYGRAILPDLRASFDPKGRAGHPRRLSLMHSLDPAGTREYVMAALDGSAGTIEVRVAAIACLGDRDLDFLIDQTKSMAKYVRQAAYRALVTIDQPTARTAIEAALTRQDAMVHAALRDNRNENVLALHIATIDTTVASLVKLTDKKEISKSVGHIIDLLQTLIERVDPATEALLRRLFAMRNELFKIRGDAASGTEINTWVIRLMTDGPKPMQVLLANAHAELPADDVGMAFRAARQALPADAVFDAFSPYLTPAMGSKKSAKEWVAKRDSILSAFRGNHSFYYHTSSIKQILPPLDPRWLDFAVSLENLDLIGEVLRPGHARLISFLSKRFALAIPKAKSIDNVREVLEAMVRSEHPEATKALIGAFEKLHKKSSHYSYWYTQLISDLPKAAIPQLEALLPKLGEREADLWIDAIQQLRDKK